MSGARFRCVVADQGRQKDIKKRNKNENEKSGGRRHAEKLPLFKKSWKKSSRDILRSNLIMAVHAYLSAIVSDSMLSYSVSFYIHC